ncbi:hypothetical protein [Streptomyces sp. NPDC049040]|uniref:hypothetical protein n=1 Tax=Streptomyces sp. NPDC049040 TaxID=3365593 RepID=UPI00371FFAB4
MSEKSEARRVGRLGRQARAFAHRHGGADACVEYLGRRGARLVLVGKDGQWGDLVAPTYAVAEAAAASAELTVHEEFGGELAAQVGTGPYEWRRMAGIQIGGRPNT